MDSVRGRFNRTRRFGRFRFCGDDFDAVSEDIRAGKLKTGERATGAAGDAHGRGSGAYFQRHAGGAVGV